MSYNSIYHSENKYEELCKLLKTAKEGHVFSELQYKGVHWARDYPLDTFAGHKKRGMWIIKGQKAKFKNEYGEPLFTSSQLTDPPFIRFSRDIGKQQNCIYQNI